MLPSDSWPSEHLQVSSSPMKHRRPPDQSALLPFQGVILILLDVLAAFKLRSEHAKGLSQEERKGFHQSTLLEGVRQQVFDACLPQSSE